jgi:hypothetical protein
MEALNAYDPGYDAAVEARRAARIQANLPAPLDKGLNCAILHIAGRLLPTGYDVAPDAPASYRALRAHLDAGKRMVVYDGGSEGTIYADPEVNYAMRAWHDWAHYTCGNDFSIEGETANCRVQQAQLLELYGDCETTRRWCRILDAEIIGQRLYYAKHGTYVRDQRAFVLHYLANPRTALETVH